MQNPTLHFSQFVCIQRRFFVWAWHCTVYPLSCRRPVLATLHSLSSQL